MSAVKIILFYNALIYIYIFFVNNLYFIITIFALFELVRYIKHIRRMRVEHKYEAARNYSMSLIVPGYNEEASIVQSIKSMLMLNYPNLEIIVINDGSTDNMLQEVIKHYKMTKIPPVMQKTIETKPVRAVYKSMEYANLYLIDKENGGKADSMNAGINFARNDYVCVVDADSILDENSLLFAMQKIFLDSTVIAVGGLIRVVNDSDVEAGRVKSYRLPKKIITMFQTIEYIRAFLIGRVGWNPLNGLLIVSGAFGIFKREIVLNIKGFRTDTIGEDMDIIIRLHKYMKDKKEKYRIAFIPDPVCWTEAPERWADLKKQRNRWQRGTLECIRNNKSMLFNPKYGVVGLVALPYFAIVEGYGPLIELSGYVVILLSYFLGMLNMKALIIFFVLSVVYGMVLSLSAFILEQMTLKHYVRIGDIFKLFLFALLENLGYRQAHLVMRLTGIIDFWRGKGGWGEMKRKGF